MGVKYRTLRWAIPVDGEGVCVGEGVSEGEGGGVVYRGRGRCI